MIWPRLASNFPGSCFYPLSTHQNFHAKYFEPLGIDTRVLAVCGVDSEPPCRCLGASVGVAVTDATPGNHRNQWQLTAFWAEEQTQPLRIQAGRARGRGVLWVVEMDGHRIHLQSILFVLLTDKSSQPPYWLHERLMVAGMLCGDGEPPGPWWRSLRTMRTFVMIAHSGKGKQVPIGSGLWTPGLMGTDLPLGLMSLGGKQEVVSV